MAPFYFIIIVLLSLIFFYAGTGYNKKVVLIFLLWQVIIGGFAVTGIFEKKPNLFPLAIAGTILLTWLTYKKIDKQKLNPKFLLAIHLLRIPVELILYQLYLQKKIPLLMTFKGWNFDILIGLSALLLLLLLLFTSIKINKTFFFIWNITGLLFLLFIVTLAILSSPLPVQRLAFNQPNIALLQFSYCFLPTCIVPIVMLSHLLLLKKEE